MLTSQQIDALLNSEQHERAATEAEIQLLQSFLQQTAQSLAITNVKVIKETAAERSFSFSVQSDSAAYQLSDSYFATVPK